MALLFSRNCKKNLLCTCIFSQLEQLGKDEVIHYMKGYPNVIDYNLVQHGNLLCYYDDIKDLFKACGYKTKFSNDTIWNYYRVLVHEVIQILNDKIGYYK